MRRIGAAAVAVAAICPAVPAAAHDPAPSSTVEWVDPESAEAQGSARSMKAVGHHDLGGRGYNADVWVHERYAYVGSWGFPDWAQGSKERFCPNDGVAVVNTLDPARPRHVADLESPPGTALQQPREPAGAEALDRRVSRSAASRGSVLGFVASRATSAPATPAAGTCSAASGRPGRSRSWWPRPGRSPSAEPGGLHPPHLAPSLRPPDPRGGRDRRVRRPARRDAARRVPGRRGRRDRRLRRARPGRRLTQLVRAAGPADRQHGAGDAVDSIRAMTLILNASRCSGSPSTSSASCSPAAGATTRTISRPSRRAATRARPVRRRLEPARAGGWAAGSAFGLLSVNTTLYAGPLADLAGGIDLSLVGSGAIAAAAYAAALVVWPEEV